MAPLVPERLPPLPLSPQPSRASAWALSLALHLLPLVGILLDLLALNSMAAGIPPPISVELVTLTDVPDDAAATATASDTLVPDAKPVLADPAKIEQPLPAQSVQPAPPTPAEQAPESSKPDMAQPDYTFLQPAKPIEVVPIAPTAPTPGQQVQPSTQPAAPAAEDTIGPDKAGSGFGASTPSTGSGGLGIDRDIPQMYLRMALDGEIDAKYQPQMYEFLEKLFACGVHTIPNSTPLLTVEVDLRFNMDGFVYAAALVHPEAYAGNPDYDKLATMLMMALHKPSCARIRLPMADHLRWGSARLLLSQKQSASAPIIVKPHFLPSPGYPALPPQTQ